MPIQSWDPQLAGAIKNLLFGPALIAVMLIIGCVVLWRRADCRREARDLTILTLIYILYLSSPTTLVLQRLFLKRYPTVKLDDQNSCIWKSPTIVILLGGLDSPDLPNSASLGRLQAAVPLLRAMTKQNIGRKVVLSGGPTFPQEPITEALIVKRFLRMELGTEIGKHQIELEEKSLNTYQNAAYTNEMIRSHGWKPNIVLVTGSWHMPRAEATFKKFGLEVCPLPYAEAPSQKWFSFVNGERNFQVLNEIFGSLGYRLRGWL